MNAEIRFVFNELKRNDRDCWLPVLRKWIKVNAPLFQRLGIDIKERIESLETALSWRAETPLNRLVVALGYGRKEVETIGSKSLGASGEPVIVGDPLAAKAGAGSASFSWIEPVISAADVRYQLRKSLIRIALRNRYTIRSPENDSELSSYFSLRHRVWKSMGYLKEEYKAARIEWEVDLWDRMSIPLVAISRDGETVGCVRLIRSFGNEEERYVAAIKSLLDKKGDPALLGFFDYPKKMEQPFDVLVEFPDFRPRYSQLVRERKSVAEIGRVAVAEEQRGGFLSEALVDTALACAEKRRVSTVILACPEKLKGLYANCGFKQSPTPAAEGFFNIRVRSIMMEKELR